MSNIPIKPCKDGLAVDIRVHPGSSKKGVEYSGEGRIQVYVNAPPQAGRANKEALNVFAKAIGVKRAAVALVRGEKSRDKTLLISGLDLETLKARLEA
jgi:uncharacterized protein (TIGR00251 family)